MSAHERGVSRIPLSVKNTSTQEAAARGEPVKLQKSVQPPPPPRSQNVLASQQIRSRVPVSRLPSFVSRSHYDLDRSNQENVAPTAAIEAATTPKKRAPPLDSAHNRNVPAYSPSKKSRSSVTGTGSSTTEQSNGTTAALENDLNSIKVADTQRPNPAVAPAAPARLPPHINPSAVAYTKTLRIDRNLRVPDNDKVDQQGHTEREIWRQKWKRAFPSFIFHFDSMDEATVKSLTKIIHHLGGTVDEFFSRNITHVVTSRTIPDASGLQDKENEELDQNGESLDKPKADRKKAFRPAFLTSRVATSKSSVTNEASRHRPLPLFSERNPFEERPAPTPSSNDILVKAQSFGIKVWRHEKLKNMLSMLLDRPLRNTQGPEKQDLSQMLEKEKIYGTVERDPEAARANFKYFSKHNFYVLVEDATLEHRPIMAQEFVHTREDIVRGSPPPWPVLYDHTGGRCPFIEPKERDRVAEERETSILRPEPQQTMRRAVSLTNMTRNHFSGSMPRTPINVRPHRGRHDYPMASGNSVSITSNIASTTSTAFTDHHTGVAVGLPQNRRVSELNRRMHTPYASHNARAFDASPASIAAGSAGSGLGINRDGNSPIGGFPLQRSGFNPEQGATVRKMLGLTNPAPGLNAAHAGLRRSVSTGAVERPPPSNPKPGYCENCRIKYDDFTEHIYSRKHRKFATDQGNFVDIDALILRVARQPLPQYEDELDSSIDYPVEHLPSSQPDDMSYADDEGSASAGSVMEDDSGLPLADENQSR